MPIAYPHGRTWAVRRHGELVPLDAAETYFLLSAASGLAAALCHARQVATALLVAQAYLPLKAADALMPLSTFNELQSVKRSLACVCLTDTLHVAVEKDSLAIPLTMVHTITTEGRRGWRDYRGAIRLIDGSVYNHARLRTTSLKLLTLLGTQTVDLRQARVTLRGRTVDELGALRQGLAATLERHHGDLVEKIGEATFGQFFRLAA